MRKHILARTHKKMRQSDETRGKHEKVRNHGCQLSANSDVRIGESIARSRRTKGQESLPLSLQGKAYFGEMEIEEICK